MPNITLHSRIHTKKCLVEELSKVTDPVTAIDMDAVINAYLLDFTNNHKTKPNKITTHYHDVMANAIAVCKKNLIYNK